MATFDEQPLDLTVTGAVALLATASPVTWIEALPHGVTVRLTEGSHGVIVENLSTGTPTDLRVLARERANEALDLASVRSVASLALSGPTEPALTWQPEASGPVLRVSWEVHATFRMRIGQQTPSPLAWHRSFRYFRMSQSTADLYDAFRNIYLALEALLSDIEPVQVNASGRPEGEGVWVERALQTAERVLQTGTPPRSLADYLPVTAPKTDPVQEVKDDLYAATRTHLFHAKAGRAVALPLDRADQDRVLGALTRYARLYTDLAELRLGARYLRSGISDHAVIEAFNTHMTDWDLGVAGSTYDTQEVFERAVATELVVLPTRRASELDGHRRGALLAEADVNSAGLPDQVRTVGARSRADGHAVSFDPLEGVLALEGVARLQIESTWAIFSDGTRTVYES